MGRSEPERGGVASRAGSGFRELLGRAVDSRVREWQRHAAGSRPAISDRGGGVLRGEVRRCGARFRCHRRQCGLAVARWRALSRGAGADPRWHGERQAREPEASGSQAASGDLRSGRGALARFRAGIDRVHPRDARSRAADDRARQRVDAAGRRFPQGGHRLHAPLGFTATEKTRGAGRGERDYRLDRDLSARQRAARDRALAGIEVDALAGGGAHGSERHGSRSSRPARRGAANRAGLAGLCDRGLLRHSPADFPRRDRCRAGMGGPRAGDEAARFHGQSAPRGAAGLARNWDEFLRFGPRKPVGVSIELLGSDDSLEGQPALLKQTAALDTDFTRPMNTEVPLRLWMSAANSNGLPREFQAQIAEAGWVRAVLLDDRTAARALARRAAELSPALAPAMRDYLAQSDPRAAGFTAAFWMLRMPGLIPELS